MHKTKHLNVNQLIFDMTSVTAHLGKPILIIHDVQVQIGCLWNSSVILLWLRKANSQIKKKLWISNSWGSMFRQLQSKQAHNLWEWCVIHFRVIYMNNAHLCGRFPASIWIESSSIAQVDKMLPLFII